MILQKLKRRVSLHTAASETMKVPDNKVGRIIGKNGVTIEAIKSLSGVQDIDFSERPSGFEALFNPERTCTITGSHDEIEKAKKLINQVVDGEDIVTNARIAAVLLRLQDDDSSCVLS